jgi:D-amino-acid dehydrogenase
LPQAAPWLLAFFAASRPQCLVETARIMRSLFARALADDEALLADAGALRYAMQRSPPPKASSSWPPSSASRIGRSTSTERACSSPIWLGSFVAPCTGPAPLSLSNPLAVTKAYAAHLARLGGVLLSGNAGLLHRADGRWRIETAEGPIDASEVVMALGPFAPDVLRPLGIRLPLGIKRGYHLHFRTNQNAGLTRPVVRRKRLLSCTHGAGIRLTTGAEFVARTAQPSPVQLDRLLPDARRLLPLAEAVEAAPWMGCRPCFADSRPVISRVPDRAGLARLWAWPLGPDARSRHRAARGRDDDGGDAVLRSGTLQRGALQAVRARNSARPVRSVIGLCAPRPGSADW